MRTPKLLSISPLELEPKEGENILKSLHHLVQLILVINYHFRSQNSFLGLTKFNKLILVFILQFLLLILLVEIYHYNASLSAIPINVFIFI